MKLILGFVTLWLIICMYFWLCANIFALNELIVIIGSQVRTSKCFSKRYVLSCLVTNSNAIVSDNFQVLLRTIWHRIFRHPYHNDSWHGMKRFDECCLYANSTLSVNLSIQDERLNGNWWKWYHHFQNVRKRRHHIHKKTKYVKTRMKP